MAAATGRLDGKTALITGGSGSIGLASARVFLAEGAEVMIVDRDEDALGRAHAEPGSEKLAVMTVDVTSSEQVKAAVADTVQRFGKLDIAFANAGIFGQVTPVTEYPVDEEAAAVRPAGGGRRHAAGRRDAHRRARERHLSHRSWRPGGRLFHAAAVRPLVSTFAFAEIDDAVAAMESGQIVKRRDPDQATDARDRRYAGFTQEALVA